MAGIAQDQRVVDLRAWTFAPLFDEVFRDLSRSLRLSIHCRGSKLSVQKARWLVLEVGQRIGLRGWFDELVVVRWLRPPHRLKDGIILPARRIEAREVGRPIVLAHTLRCWLGSVQALEDWSFRPSQELRCWCQGALRPRRTQALPERINCCCRVAHSILVRVLSSASSRCRRSTPMWIPNQELAPLSHHLPTVLQDALQKDTHVSIVQSTRNIT